MAARLVIAEKAYLLLEARGDQWAEMAVLPGGADALVPGTWPMDEGRLEAAIEQAEDWLMPPAARLRGEILEVRDPTGRLKSGLDKVLSVQTSGWGIADVLLRFEAALPHRRRAET